MINFLELKNSNDKDNLLNKELITLKKYIASQMDLEKSINDRIEIIDSSINEKIAEDLNKIQKQISTNIDNLNTLQELLTSLEDKETIDAVTIKSYNQLYLDVELNINETTEASEKSVKEFDEKKSAIKALETIAENSQNNVTCFFPKSDADIFAVSTIHKKYSIYINKNNTVRVSIDEEDFDISIKTPNVQISNNESTILISRKETGYEITTNLNVELSNHINISKIYKDNDFLKFDINAFEFTLSVSEDKLSFIDAKNIEIKNIVPSESIPIISHTNNTPKDMSKEQYDEALDSITANANKPNHTPTDSSTNSKDNNTLIISNETGKITLPYKLEDLEATLEKNPKKYSSINDVIEKDYTISTEQFKNPIKSRFKEAYKLVKKKEKGSLKEALDLGIELMFQSNLNPAIITACKNLEELDIYLNCLDENDLDKFNCFEIIYKVPPAKK